jgi:hypothetical protein
VSDSNAAEDEQDRDAGQRQQPGEDCSAVGRKVDVCQQSEKQLDNDHDDGTTFLIDVSGELRTHAYSMQLVKEQCS